MFRDMRYITQFDAHCYWITGFRKVFVMIEGTAIIGGELMDSFSYLLAIIPAALLSSIIYIYPAMISFISEGFSYIIYFTAFYVGTSCYLLAVIYNTFLYGINDWCFMDLFIGNPPIVSPHPPIVYPHPPRPPTPPPNPRPGPLVPRPPVPTPPPSPRHDKIVTPILLTLVLWGFITLAFIGGFDISSYGIFQSLCGIVSGFDISSLDGIFQSLCGTLPGLIIYWL